MEFREMLQQTRKARGWSQEDLAEKIQVSRQAVSKWETGDAMPDLPKLLALADALDLSLDTLCGRGAPAPDSSIPSTSETNATPENTHSITRSRRIWMLLCGMMAVCLLATSLWAWSRRDYVPAEHAAAQTVLPDTFTVTGVSFSSLKGTGVRYRFTPSITGEGLTYQITFTDSFGKSRTYKATLDGAICSDTLELPAGVAYAVTVSVTDGTNARHLAVAKNLTFDRDSASWFPLDENT